MEGDIFKAEGYSPGGELQFIYDKVNEKPLALNGVVSPKRVKEFCLDLIVTITNLNKCYSESVAWVSENPRPTIKGATLNEWESEVTSRLFRLNQLLAIILHDSTTLLKLAGVTPEGLMDRMEGVLTTENLQDNIYFRDSPLKTVLSYCSYVMRYKYEMPNLKPESFNVGRFIDIQQISPGKSYNFLTAAGFWGIGLNSYLKMLSMDCICNTTDVVNFLDNPKLDMLGTEHREEFKSKVIDLLLANSVLLTHLDININNVVPLVKFTID